MSHNSLRWSTMRLVALVFSGLLVVALVVFYGVAHERFLALEKSTGFQSINQVSQSLKSVRQTYASKTEDWAFWDDTVHFIETLDPAYVKSNLGADSAETINVEGMIFLSKEGEVKGTYYYSDALKDDTELKERVDALTQKDSIILRANREQRTLAGFLATSQKIALVVGSPILKSDRTGPPFGSLIFIKLLDEKLLKAIRETAQRDFRLASRNAPNISPEIAKHLSVLDSEGELVNQEDPEKMRSFALVSDIFGNASIVLDIVEARPIYREGQKTLIVAVGLLVGSATLFAGVLFYLIEHHVVGRILSLSKQLKGIQSKNDLSTHISLQGQDEIQELAGSVNYLLSRIAKSYDELEKSRDQMYVQSLRFAEQVELLTKTRDQTLAKERDTSLLLKTVILQLRSTITNTTDSYKTLHSESFSNEHREHVTVVCRAWEQLEDIMKETQAVLDPEICDSRFSKNRRDR